MSNTLAPAQHLEPPIASTPALSTGWKDLPDGQDWMMYPVFELDVGLDALATRLGVPVVEAEDDLDAFGVILYELAGVRTYFQSYRYRRDTTATLWMDAYALAKQGRDVLEAAELLQRLLALEDLTPGWFNDSWPNLNQG